MNKEANKTNDEIVQGEVPGKTLRQKKSKESVDIEMLKAEIQTLKSIIQSNQNVDISEDAQIRSNVELLKQRKRKNAEQYSKKNIVDEEEYEVPSRDNKIKKFVKRTFRNGVIKNYLIGVYKNGRLVGTRGV